MAQEFNNIELKDENVNTNKTSRRSFIKKWGILSLAGLFGLSKMGNMPVVKAAVNDNAEAKDISNDVIRCNTNDVFTSGETAADLADAVNGLNQSFSNALTDLKNTDVAKAVGANGSKFPIVIGVLGAIKTYLSGAVSKDVQVGSSYKIPEGYHDGSSEIKAVAKSGTNPTQITTNGTHSTGGYESVNVQVSATATLVYTRWSDPYSGAYNQGLVGIDLSQYVAVLMRINGLSSGDGKIVYCTKGSRVVIGDYSGTSGGGRGFTVENGGIREDINGNSYGAWGSAYVSQVWGLKNYIV